MCDWLVASADRRISVVFGLKLNTQGSKLKRFNLKFTLLQLQMVLGFDLGAQRETANNFGPE